jgi:hypothetical protein
MKSLDNFDVGLAEPVPSLWKGINIVWSGELEGRK